MVILVKFVDIILCKKITKFVGLLIKYIQNSQYMYLLKVKSIIFIYIYLKCIAFICQRPKWVWHFAALSFENNYAVLNFSTSSR